MQSRRQTVTPFKCSGASRLSTQSRPECRAGGAVRASGVYRYAV